MFARIRSSKPVVVLVVLMLAAWPAVGQDLVLLHLADTHSAYERYPRLLALVRDTVEGYDAETAILIDGDVFESGHAVAAGSQGAGDWAFLEALDRIAPVVLNLGNHEFDFLTPDALVAEADARGIELIGTLVDRATGEMLVPPVATLAAGGRVIDVVGIATDQVATYAEPAREALAFTDPVAFGDLLGPSTVLADHVVVLSHAGVVADRELSAKLPSAALYVVGAHDHLVLHDEGAGVPYLHGGFRGERLLVAEVAFAADGAAEVVFRERPTDEHDAVDAGLEQVLVDLADEALGDEQREVVGTVPAALDVREAADWAVRTLARATDADVAFLNHTSFGAGLDAGPLPRYRFDAFLRFDNDVMVTEMDGATLARVLALADQGPDTPLEARTGDFLYGSGFEGTPDPDRRYRVVTSSWVALPFNQATYLGADGVPFEPIDGVTVKGILRDALR